MGDLGKWPGGRRPGPGGGACSRNRPPAAGFKMAIRRSTGRWGDSCPRRRGRSSGLMGGHRRPARGPRHQGERGISSPGPPSMPAPHLPCHASEPAGSQGTTPEGRVRSPDTRGGRCARAAGGGRQSTQTAGDEVAGLEVGAAGRRTGGRATRWGSRGLNRRRSHSGSPRRRGQRRSDRQGHLRIVGAHGHSPRHARGCP